MIKKMVNSLNNGIIKATNVFRSTYTVNAITYVVVPGVPINKNENKHVFEKGQYEEAVKFYHQVVRRTEQLGFSPAEILLVKGKNKVVQRKNFGPIDEIKELPTIINV